MLFASQGGQALGTLIQQEHTALSLCEAKILATNECITHLQSIKYRVHDIGLRNASDCTTISNNNQACVQWSASITNNQP